MMTEDGENANFWSGRFEKPPHQLFQQLNASITFDWRLAPYDIQGSIAHARMLSDIGVLTIEEFGEIEMGLGQIMAEIAQGQFDFQLADEDIHTAVEKRLIEIAGDVGKKLHTARSRNDQVATGLALFVRDQARQHFSDLVVLQEALLEQAEAAGEAVLPGYTHLQRAQPVLLAHHLLAYFEMFGRDCGRFLRVIEATAAMPLGAGALAGVNYPVKREQVASELGFTHPGANSIDDVSNRDFALDYLAAAASMSIHLSRLAAELILWSSQEFGFVEIADEFTSGSSIMPQKKNPDACELMRAKAARVAANHQGLISLMAGLPLAYNKDMQEDKIYVFDTTDILLLVIPVAAEMTRSLKFDAARMRAAAEASFALATDVADYLVTRGVAFRDAHRIVGRLVKKCIGENRLLKDLSIGELQAESPRFDQGYYDAVDLEAALARKQSYGGTAPERVRAQLEAAAARLAGLRQAAEELREA
ncbi:MAG: argininosuccinate lyase [Actinomycetota bacterium]|jgi:argininosuccinate lyase|nr:argininosuccinate lyase [Actinomycetota bacterium]MCL6093769.1 argininosuccinate lyase [Actinomycetota bacterium]MDA8166605.1 argininosuccinate lyase [Actinomycetota bacterium]